MVSIYKNSFRLVFLILSLLVLTACSGLFGLKAENKVEDKLSNEELIDMALEDFIEVGNYDSFISRACPENPSVSDIREVTDINIWDGKYIELIVKGEYEPNSFGEEQNVENHKFYKFEDGELKDSYRWDSVNELPTDDFGAREFDILHKEPDYSEENDGVYFLEYVGCDKEK